ncbi:MAG: stage III sporulation protein AB [Oscillospiraceae bacterium]|nr:stage III sporulation protein AB [Oscillospiraceae bacterium]
MSSKILGSLLVILGCGGFGFSMAAACRREERQLTELMDILQYIYCDLRYHLTPLPDLCRKAAKQGRGELYRLFEGVGDILQQGTLPQVSDCVYLALTGSDISPTIRELLIVMGQTMGQFDLEGQLIGLNSLKERCAQSLETLRQGKTDRLRSYQTLGLCAGAALVILFV